jgi:hypothetical protein
MASSNAEKRKFEYRVRTDIIDVLMEEDDIDVPYGIKWNDKTPVGKSSIPNLSILRNIIGGTPFEGVLNDLINKLEKHKL